MSKTLNLAGMLDFSEVDLTAPDKVIEEILEQLPEDTQNSRNEVEDLIVKILTSKKVLRVMQEFIRIHQAKSSNNIPDSLHDGTSNAE